MTMVGRDREAAAVLALASGSLVLTGEAGSGKSTMLELAALRASGGRRVLRADGAPNETNIPFAALHQLLRPVLHEAGALSPRQRSALLTAVGSVDGGTAPDRLIIGVAVLELLSGLAQHTPVLVVADDVQWFDADSREMLAFAARRIGEEPLAVLAATREQAALPGLPTLELGPLDRRAANLLLDAQPRPPGERRRALILSQAAGNPLALIELARADTTDTDVDVLPPTERLERIFAADLDALPAATRHALLLAAAETSDLVTTRYAEALAPAERSGLIRITGTRLRFRHSLAASAVYHRAPLETRRRAHLELADLLRSEPDRRAWHLAAAARGPDDTVATTLEDTAATARLRGGYSAAATALERAAELSTTPHERARRLVLAAGDALFTGQPSWVERLASRVATVTDEPSPLAAAALRVGQVLTLTSQHDRAYSLLEESARDPASAGEACASAAVVAFYSGDEQMRATVYRQAAGDPWTAVVTDPFEHRSEMAARLSTLVSAADGDPGRLMALGTMAWMLDETSLAVRIFDDALHRWRATGRLPAKLGCASGWAYLDHGRWAQARLVAADTRSLADEAGLAHLGAAAMALEAATLALTGDTPTARALAEQALRSIDPLHSRAVAAQARWALGMTAVADGDHETAYTQFRSQFTDDGRPVHYYCSYAALAEFSAAAVRTGHRQEAVDIIDRAAKRLSGDASPHIRMRLHRSRALLGLEDVEAHFEAALDEPAGEQRPFERAVIMLEYAQWLRRQRRIAEARPKLLAAAETFKRLGARPWAERSQEELRAAGVDTQPATPEALTMLTPQQQHIIRLAARGLTNREIAEHLFLSPHTVASHLYRSYPKLGITTRAQLRDLVDGSRTGRTADPPLPSAAQG
ncbi:AAA family ATPase [Nonomuraea lactucae]|uniref:AAA family ATPase n=1 Tax=Nonomuraea lactucae TaxID=2249762 RepID=UPI000DE569D3|nr:AAA family ATPase [Nonomuraea lactucae]